MTQISGKVTSVLIGDDCISQPVDPSQIGAIHSDYSRFPFSDFTVSEVFALARESKELHDDDFVKACIEAIRLNKCKQEDRVIEP